MRCSISFTVVQQSVRIDTLYFSAEREMAVWVTQFWVIMPQTSNSLTPSCDSVSFERGIDEAVGEMP